MDNIDMMCVLDADNGYFHRRFFTIGDCLDYYDGLCDKSLTMEDDTL
jgi:hypothetical protein